MKRSEANSGLRAAMVRIGAYLRAVKCVFVESRQRRGEGCEAGVGEGRMWSWQSPEAFSLALHRLDNMTVVSDKPDPCSRCSIFTE